MDLKRDDSVVYKLFRTVERLSPGPTVALPSPGEQGKVVAGFPTIAVRPSRQSNIKQRETVPMDLHHPILREFPEHRDAIRHLKNNDEHFRNLFEEYHRLDDEIYRIEEEIDFATDQEIEELKMRRAKLKDDIYHLIRRGVSPTCPSYSGAGVAH